MPNQIGESEFARPVRPIKLVGRNTLNHPKGSPAQFFIVFEKSRDVCDFHFAFYAELKTGVKSR